MWTSPFSASRQVQTTIACHECGHAVMARRLCREVRIECEKCNKTFQLEEYVKEMDEPLEEFLQAVFCDRM